MVTPQQLTAARAFLTACPPANALRQRAATQSHRDWQVERQAADANRYAARTALQELCVTRAVYQEAIVAARASG